MDPLTQILAIISSIIKYQTIVLESLPPEKRVELATMQMDDLKRWREFFDGIGKLFKRDA